jgi:ankyrin repeat protein
MSAAVGGSTEIVDLLLEKGANIDATNSSDQSALWWAAVPLRRAKMVAFLLSRGANPNIVASNGETPLQRISGNSNPEWIEIARLLLEGGASPNFATTRGDLPLHLAVRWGSIEMIKLLLAHGAVPNIRDKEGWTALDYAQGRGDDSVIALLRESSQNDADRSSHHGETGRGPSNSVP